MPEAEGEFQALRRGLARGTGFSLYMAVCNSPVRRDHLVAQLAESLPSVPPAMAVVKPVRIEPLYQVLDQIGQAAGPVMVALSEDFFRDEETGHQLLGSLNLERPRWPEAIKRPVVWWAAEFQAGRLLTGAPDFFNWRSGFFRFDTDDADPYDVLAPMTHADAGWGGLPVDVRRRRIGEIRARIAVNEDARDGQVRRLVAGWLHELANHYAFFGELDAAEAVLRCELRIGQQLGDEAIGASAVGGLGRTQAMRGNLDVGEPLLRQALAADRKLGRVQAAAAALANLGNVARHRGDLDAAERAFREAADLSQTTGDTAGRAGSLHNLGGVAMLRGDLAAAESLGREALDLYHRSGRLDGEAMVLVNLGLLAKARGDLNAAQQLHEEGLRLDRATGRLEGELNHLTSLGLIAATRGEVVMARSWWTQALTRIDPFGPSPWTGRLQHLIDQLAAPIPVPPV